MNQTDEGLIDLVYETALAPELWPRALEKLSDFVGRATACLIRQNQVTGAGESLYARVDPTSARSYFGYYATRNPLLKVDDPQAFMRRWTPRILCDEEWMDKSVLRRSEYHHDFLRPLDIDSVLFVRLAARGLDHVVINLFRSTRHGQFGADEIERTQALQPHLIRAFALGQKLGEAGEPGRGLVDLLEASRDGLFVLDAAGRMRWANRAAEALLAEPDGLTVEGGRLTASSAGDARRLQGLVSQAAAPGYGKPSGGSMGLATPGRRRPLSVLVTPARSERTVFFGAERSVIVCVSDLGAAVDLPQQRLRDLFGLSAAETKVAFAIFRGLSPREAAAELGSSYFTVRAHLVRIYAKTGTSRQSELAALMARAGGARLDS